MDSSSLPTTELPFRHPSLTTLSLHADDALNTTTDIAPAVHTATTFRYPKNPDLLSPAHDATTPPHPPGGPAPSTSHIYSRISAPNTSRLEMILTSLLGAPALTYSSGLAAFHALLVWYHPKVVAIGDGYHGCHAVLDIYRKLTNCKVVSLFADDAVWDAAGLGDGDLVHLETPLNPSGKAFDVRHFAERAHRRKALLSVDATFAPPPLLDPFRLGADVVMHSGTKYFGGHSDMLCGVLAVGTRHGDGEEREGWEKEYWGLYRERLALGAVMGSLEGWLGVRSLRTLELRVRAQSQGCEKLVQWLDSCVNGGEGTEGEVVRKVVQKVEHASLQKNDMVWLKEQMPNGYGPVFAIWLRSGELAKTLPSCLHLFQHATSLGGVESLIEWRRMSDKGVEDTLLRVSVGIEGWEDLKDDLMKGFKALIEQHKA